MDSTTTKGGKKRMPATSDTQKGTAMDYLSAPRDSGIVKDIMSLIGFTAKKGGRLPAGCKYDTLIALKDALDGDDGDEFRSILASRVVELQTARRKSSAKVRATPESIVQAVKMGKISLADLKAQLEAIEEMDS